MREFNKVSAKFWMTSLVKKLKQQGSEALLLAIYLQTNHHSHSLGIFYLPLDYIAHDIGVNVEVVKKLLRQLIELGFCSYDFEEEYIWVKNYALEQAGGPLKPGDNRIHQLQKHYEELPALNFLEDFFIAHQEDFHLTRAHQEVVKIQSVKVKVEETKDSSEAPSKVLPSPLAAPLNPLRSTETETKKKTETETETEINFVAQTRPGLAVKPVEKIFEHWKHTMQHPKAKLDSKRRRLILQAIKLGFDCEQFCNAITGCSLTPHNVGENDRGERYDGLHVILRGADQIERFIRNYHNPPKPLSRTLQQSRNTYMSLENWIHDTEETIHAST